MTGVCVRLKLCFCIAALVVPSSLLAQGGGMGPEHIPTSLDDVELLAQEAAFRPPVRALPPRSGSGSSSGFDHNSNSRFDPTVSRFNPTAASRFDPTVSSRFSSNSPSRFDPNAKSRFDPSPSSRFDPNANSRFNSASPPRVDREERTSPRVDHSSRRSKFSPSPREQAPKLAPKTDRREDSRRDSRRESVPRRSPPALAPRRGGLQALQARRAPPASQPEITTTTPKPKIPFATANAEFRFSKPRTSPRITFIPQDRGARFDRKLLPHQIAAAAGKFSRPISEITKPVAKVTKPTTTEKPRKIVPSTSTPSKTEKPKDDYNLYDYYYDEEYYYYEDGETKNGTKSAHQEVKDELIAKNKIQISITPKTVTEGAPNHKFTTSSLRTTMSHSTSGKASLSDLLFSKLEDSKDDIKSTNISNDIAQPGSSREPRLHFTTSVMNETSETNETLENKTDSLSDTVIDEKPMQDIKSNESSMVDATIMEEKANHDDPQKSQLELKSKIVAIPEDAVEIPSTGNSEATVSLDKNVDNSSNSNGAIVEDKPLEIASSLDENVNDTSNNNAAIVEDKPSLPEPEIDVVNNKTEDEIPKSETSPSISENEQDLFLASLFGGTKKPKIDKEKENAEISQYEKDSFLASLFGGPAPSRPSPSSTDNETNQPLVKTEETHEHVIPSGFKPREETAPKIPVVKNKEIPAHLLPKGFKPTVAEDATPEVSAVEILEHLLPEDFKSLVNAEVKIPEVKTKEVPAHLLPKGFKPSGGEKKLKLPEIKAKEVPAHLLPKGFKSSKVDDEEKLPVIKEQEVPAHLLPKGFKSSIVDEAIKTKEVPAHLLPKGFKPKNDEAVTEDTSLKALFGLKEDSKAGRFPNLLNRASFLTTTVRTGEEKEVRRTKTSGVAPLRPKIENLFDRIKTTTERTAPPPTQASAYAPKKNAPLMEGAPESVGDAPTTTTRTTPRTTTTTTTTTTERPRPTTPGVCGSRCRLAGTLRLLNGTHWVPELANRDTAEWQALANALTRELNALYSRSRLNRWFVGVEVDNFSQGSVLVDYFLLLNDINAGIDTTDLKQMTNAMLAEPEQHTLGEFTVDPEYTDFVVIRERHSQSQKDDGSYLIPEWLIAVIVISLASFLFIIIFGVTVLISRARAQRRNVPLKVPLNEEMINKLNASQLSGLGGHYDPSYDLEAIWDQNTMAHHKPPSSRRHGYNPAYDVNIYDSWRTDWSGPYGSSATYGKRRLEEEQPPRGNSRTLSADTYDPYNF